MFIRDLKYKTDTTHEIILAEVHLPVKMGHRDAEKVFGAPLKAQLAATSLGTVLSCDTRTRPSGAAIGVDIGLGLRDARESALKTVAGMLEALSAPCGSSIRLADAITDPILFGQTEGLEVAVDTPLTPDAETRRDLALTCHKALDKAGVSRGWDHRQNKTVFYFYGESYSDMRSRLARVLKNMPRYQDIDIRRMA